ncbi:hypothetical protein N7509_010310 [Penicillium cosmopolitanum]|uniref:Copper transport protein n=1 Tax=Penicillium cosmopolitanum TaxID=1131564 RepID=A0A9X0B4E6_9EURO|nr:uncharacterized protein N7509_010310 [Penicillium cosmopolitanum]KAJ5387769.1 hypothetical protein N7509_010310 [Penicillium cosmopolitanum]
MMDMDMDMSSTMSMATTTGMTMSTSTSMSSMDMGSGSSMMGMSDMMMTFFTSFKTPLFSETWTPTSKGQYAGTCIFLIVLAVILRVLLVIRPLLEGRVFTDNSGHPMLDSLDEKDIQTAKPPSGLALTLLEVGSRWRRWRINPAAGRATYEVVVAGVAYLLMLGVMTMNVGYFMSILAGIWLGTFIMGSVAAESSWQHAQGC